MLRIVTTVTPENEVNIVTEEVDNPLDVELKPEEVVVRVDAAPINPSDIMTMLPTGPSEAGLKSTKQIKNGLSYNLEKKDAHFVAPRIGKMIPCGNEGAGVVVKAGSSPSAQKLLNKVVSVAVGQMYAHYRKAHIAELVVQNEGTTPEQAASSFINPLTVVGFVETMKQGKYKGIIHTAAASQLGQMLVRLCLQENINLINIVRKESQEKLLKNLGAKYIVRSDRPSFVQDLAELVKQTEITLAFDAIGGGNLISDLMIAMEMGAKEFAKSDPSSPYGTNVFKQVYTYGSLDMSPTILSRGFGFCWGISAWLLPHFLATQTREKIGEMKKTVADNINSVFKTEYYKRISMKQMVEIESFKEYLKQETGKKFLVIPSKKD